MLGLELALLFFNAVAVGSEGSWFAFLSSVASISTLLLLLLGESARSIDDDATLFPIDLTYDRGAGGNSTFGIEYADLLGSCIRNSHDGQHETAEQPGNIEHERADLPFAAISTDAEAGFSGICIICA